MKTKDWVFSIILSVVLMFGFSAWSAQQNRPHSGGILSVFARIFEVLLFADAYTDDQPPEEVREAFMAMSSQEPVVRQMGPDGSPQLNFAQGW